MNNRLKSLRKHLGFNQDEFSKKMKISRSHISSLENGARELTDRIIYDICREFSVNEAWLRTGEGEMFVQTQTFSLDEKAKQHGLSELETDIMRGYMELPIATRKELLQLFGSIYTKHAESVAAAIDPIESEEEDVEEELNILRQELKAEKKGKTSSASRVRDII